MPDIFDLVEGKAMGEYVTAAHVNAVPPLGLTLFPAKQIVGLDLKFIKGYKSQPIALRPSALGARAFVRDRIGGAELTEELPFFREKMLIDERTRQKLAQAKIDVNDPYTRGLIAKIFDDAAALVDGANVQSERERMSILFTGKIEIKASVKDGEQPYFAYDYDHDGKWAANNKVTLTSTKRWSDHANSDPLQDMIDMVAKARKVGVKLTKAICGSKTWSDIMQNANIKAMFKNPDGSQKVFGDNLALQEIKTVTGLTIAVYEDSYKDENGEGQFYVPDDAMCFLPDGTLGQTVYGTTPEQLDLMSGFGNGSTSIVNTGVSITTVKKYGPPLTVETVVSELVLPSFERMAEVFVLNY